MADAAAHEHRLSDADLNRRARTEVLRNRCGEPFCVRLDKVIKAAQPIRAGRTRRRHIAAESLLLPSQQVLQVGAW
jgi:hypothetical protein